MDSWIRELMRWMDWVPLVGSVVDPELNKTFWPNTRYQWMAGSNQTPHRRYLVRPPPPLIPPNDSHPTPQPLLRQWPSSEFLPKINIQDFRTDNYMGTTRLPDDPETGWVLGMPHRNWRPLLHKDIQKRRANFYGHFDYPTNSRSIINSNQAKAKINKKGYPFLGIAQKKQKSHDVKWVDPESFVGGYRVPPSMQFDFSYDSFPDNTMDEFRYDTQFSPITAPSITDSESLMGIFEEDRKKCGKVNQLLMYCDQKLQYFKDIPPWHRVQIGVPALRIIQAIYTIVYLTTVREHCKNNGSKLCTFMRSTDWRNIIPFFVAYFGIALPIIPYLPLPWIFYWYKTCRTFSAILFVIQTMVMAQITTAIYMHKPPATAKVIYEYQYGLLCASIFFIVYFRVKYDRQVENMPYWNAFVGCREHKTDYWISTYYGHSDTRSFPMFSSMIRQFHDIFEQARMNDPGWMRNHAILDGFIFSYYIISSGILNTLCQINVWMKQVIGAFVFNFALGIGMSVFQLYWMHHIFCQHPLVTYHWGDIFMIAIIT